MFCASADWEQKRNAAANAVKSSLEFIGDLLVSNVESLMPTQNNFFLTLKIFLQDVLSTLIKVITLRRIRIGIGIKLKESGKVFYDGSVTVNVLPWFASLST